MIFFFQIKVGTLSRKKRVFSTKIDTRKGKFLQILVENVGRNSFGVLNEVKGIYGGVLLNNKKVQKWNVTSFPFDNMSKLTNLIDSLKNAQEDSGTQKRMSQSSGKFNHEPIVYHAKFDVKNGDVHDTFIDTRGWGKVIYLDFRNVFQTIKF